MEISLNESYEVCGKTFDIFAKTGRYIRNGGEYGDSYIFSLTSNSLFVNEGQEEFSITPTVDLSYNVGLELGDHLSMAQFGRTIHFFLLYNHRNGQYKYYPRCIEGLHALFEERANFFRQFINERKLKTAAENFPKTRTFSSVLNKLQSLN